MKPSLLALSVATVTCLAIAGCSTHVDQVHNTNGTVQPHDTTENATAQGHVEKWSYDSQTGPDTWGDMEGFEACKLGHEQSPINIKSAVMSDTKVPKFNYSNSNFNVIDNYHTIKFTPTTSDNTIEVNDDTYTLKQFHYHAPSEHEISGINYPVELHFVHANAQGDLAVVGVMLYPDATSQTGHPTLARLIDVAKLTHGTHEESYTNNIDINSLLPDKTSYFHYLGSLTTPPCSEQVQWYVAQQPVSVSMDQVSSLMTMHEENSRPVQPVGERVIEYIK